jgi:hypothetical protein
LEKETEIHFYDLFFSSLGLKFRCSVLIAPVKNESCDIILFILEFTESTDHNRQRRIRMYRFVLFIKGQQFSYDNLLAKIHEYSISPTSMRMFISKFFSDY